MNHVRMVFTVLRIDVLLAIGCRLSDFGHGT